MPIRQQSVIAWQVDLCYIHLGIFNFLSQRHPLVPGKNQRFIESEAEDQQA
jgi:hypothetical protein